MPRVARSTCLVSLVLLMAAGAFQWGHARASSERLERRRTAVVDAVQHAAPAVLSVYAWAAGSRGRGSGAGVIVHPSGYVVTNSHVIRGCSRITVKPFGQRANFSARLVADDPGGDLALLKIDGERRWPYVSLASSREVMLGETAIAIGNPHGLGDTVTVGVVSAVDRPAKLSTGTTLRDLIQTDASINSGNSGGALLNLDGELIGINASLLPQAKGIAFAIPADQVASLLTRALGRSAPPRNPLPDPATPQPRLERPESPALATVPPRIERAPPAVGPAERARATPPPVVQPAPGEEVTEEPEVVPLRPDDLGLLVTDDGRHLVVARVLPGSAAARAGFLSGDMLLDVDGMPVESVDELVLAFASSYPGRRFFVAVRRGTGRASVVLTAPR